MCFLNIKACQHILLHQIHKIMIFKKASYDPFNLFLSIDKITACSFLFENVFVHVCIKCVMCVVGSGLGMSQSSRLSSSVSAMRVLNTGSDVEEALADALVKINTDTHGNSAYTLLTHKFTYPLLSDNYIPRIWCLAVLKWEIVCFMCLSTFQTFTVSTFFFLSFERNYYFYSAGMN